MTYRRYRTRDSELAWEYFAEVEGPRIYAWLAEDPYEELPPYDEWLYSRDGERAYIGWLDEELDS